MEQWWQTPAFHMNYSRATTGNESSQLIRNEEEGKLKAEVFSRTELVLLLFSISLAGFIYLQAHSLLVKLSLIPFISTEHL